MNSLDKQIDSFLNERFPKLENGPDVEDICLIYLDTKTGGCISYFQKKQYLDPWRLATLGLCYGELVKVCSKIEGKEKDYFERLKLLSKSILKEIENKEEQR